MFADGGGRNEPRASCSPPRWGGGELRGSKNRKIHVRQPDPAAGTISDKGRSRRRSVKNRSPFDCFKSAEGIRFSVVARPDPEIVSPRRFLAQPFDVKRLHKIISQNSSSAATGVARKARAVEDNTAERCADACVCLPTSCNRNRTAIRSRRGTSRSWCCP